MIGLGHRFARAVFAVRPAFDRNSRYFYAIALGALALKVVLYDLAGFTSSAKNPWDILLFCAFVIFPALMLRRVGHFRLATMIEAIMLLLIVGLICVQLQFPITAYSPWLADRFLLKADQALGFDWLTFSLLFQSQRAWRVLEFCYGCFRPEAALVIIFLCARRPLIEVWMWRYYTSHTQLRFDEVAQNGHHLVADADGLMLCHLLKWIVKHTVQGFLMILHLIKTVLQCAFRTRSLQITVQPYSPVICLFLAAS